MGPPEDTKVTFWEEIVDSLNAINGVHPGYRAVHAKGTFCDGSFTAAPEASRLSRAAHFQGDSVKTTVRLSNASGNPHTSDANPIAGRGMAVKFHLPDGEATDIVGVPVPVWMVRTPEDFLAFTKARAPDPDTGQPDPETMTAFIGEHPEAGRALQLALPKIAPTTSFVTSGYNALHAFGLVNSDGETTWGRYGWRPAEGEHYLSEDEMAAADRDYLQQEIRERLGSGTARFTLEFTLAAEGDPLDDPTVLWEGDNEVVTLGELELDEVIEDAESPGQPVVFDPMRLTDGIEPSGDRILAARPNAYSVSIERRTASA
jgi:catalase